VRLAVLIPVLNATAELDQTLQCLALDPVPFDIVIVDDGSTPPVAVPAAVGPHRVVTLRHAENRGIAHALNTGVAWIIGRGYDALARLDAGDVNHPGRLRTQVAYLEQHPEIAMLGAWTRHVDESSQALFTTRYPDTWADIRRTFHYRSPFSHPACMIRCTAFVGGDVYDTGVPLGEDYALFWRLAERFPCANIPEVLVTRLESRSSLTARHRLRTAVSRLQLQWRHFTWRRLDCWLGLARSVSLLCVPARTALVLKRIAGTVG
jgi:glycosyltransferase involved in cell wall biosynthesis